MSRIAEPKPGALWVASQPAAARQRPAVGDAVLLKATRNTLRFGQLALVGDGDGGVALAVVLGEPVKKKFAGFLRPALVTHAFPEAPIVLDPPLPSTCRRASKAEDARASALLNGPSPFQFLADAARSLQFEKVQLGRTAEILLEKMCAGQGIEAVSQTEIPRPPGHDGRMTPDLLASWRDESGRRHLLVVEAEWSQIAGADAVGQVYEYARRLHHWEHRARRARKTAIHAAVVANRVHFDPSFTAGELRVEVLDYFGFARLLASGDYAQLAEIAVNEDAKKLTNGQGPGPGGQALNPPASVA